MKTVEYYAANETFFDDEKELHYCYVGIVGGKNKPLFAAVYGNTPQTAKQNADEAVKALNGGIQITNIQKAIFK